MSVLTEQVEQTPMSPTYVALMCLSKLACMARGFLFPAGRGGKENPGLAPGGIEWVCWHELQTDCAAFQLYPGDSEKSGWGEEKILPTGRAPGSILVSQFVKREEWLWPQLYCGSRAVAGGWLLGQGFGWSKMGGSLGMRRRGRRA